MSGGQPLAGRVAIVTGGARGIGLAVADALAAAGASLVIADNGTGSDGTGADPTIAEAAARHIGGETLAFTESIASPSAAAACVALAKRRLGGLDIVIHGAAIRRDAAIVDGVAADWEAVLRNNLSAAWYLLNAAAPVWRDQGGRGRGGRHGYRWGRVVNLVSGAGLCGGPAQGAAAAASAGLISLTRVAALDLAPDHVTCNALALLDTGENGLHAPTPAKVISWLCTDAAVDVSGQLFGVRGREVLLFSPPQPVARLADATDWSIDQFSQAALAGIAGRSSALDAGTPALEHAPPA